ncbi:MAG: discoidin domain-containing protein [Kiritimatiellae bacterium]|nr:discoidin domain-containing protein [Kiritimatiellia bacterium]
MKTTERKRFQKRVIIWAMAALMAAGNGFAVTKKEQPAGAAQVTILLSPTASAPEKIAAEELMSYLSKLYPATRFTAGANLKGGSSFTIRLGTPASTPELAATVGREKVAQPESYVVTTDGPQSGIILGADPRGVIYGVYGLLEKLGCGFYLTSDSLPEALPGTFSLQGWDLADHPLVRDRFVFNWHNFLSGCTGWDYPDWESWIVQSQKMGFNTIMVHAYGNNPMFTYTFNGITKPVGYYGSSRKGRDWGRQHINDVRWIPGGEIFDGPEFGSEAALVPDDQRIEAAQALMQRAFTCAEQRGVDVCFSLDIDTTSVLLQEMILTLPESDRFHNGRNWLPIPDSKEGAEFYRAQVVALLKMYPEIDMIALWRRVNAEEWGRLKKLEQLPAAWHPGYQEIIVKNPAAAKLPQAVCSYALSKVVGALRSALDELGRRDVRIGMGSWDTSYVTSLAAFLPHEVTIMPLDSSCMRYRRGFFFEVPAARAELESARSRILPIIWAHHDDGEYIGRPMKSHDNFCDTLENLDASGYGIIHWMKRPLDLHFRNHEKQVWASSRNQSCMETCQRAAHDWFGETNRERMTRYLYAWWTEAPNFGRVTTDKFFIGSEKIPDPQAAILGCQQRLELLASIDLSAMTPAGRNRVAYFQELEAMIISFCKVQELAFRPAVQALSAGNFAEAQRLLESADPLETMRSFSRLSQLDGKDRSEEAMVLSLGTRWLPDYIAARQKAGLEPVRINFAPTSHEPLAQSQGSKTFFIDDGGDYWSVQGRGAKRISTALEDDIYTSVRATGLLIEAPVTIPLSAIVPIGGQFRPGQYEATLLLEGAGEGEVSLDNETGVSVVSFEPVRAAYLRVVCNGNSENNWNSIHRVGIKSLADGAPAEVVRASHAEAGYPATAVLDTVADSRWASTGKAWIQFKLNPARAIDSLEITWYQGKRRQANYSLETSDDGKNWRKLESKISDAASDAHPFVVKAGAGGEVKITGQLDTPGELSLNLKHRQGKPVVAGMVLRRVAD